MPEALGQPKITRGLRGNGLPDTPQTLARLSSQRSRKWLCRVTFRDMDVGAKTDPHSQLLRVAGAAGSSAPQPRLHLLQRSLAENTAAHPTPPSIASPGPSVPKSTDHWKVSLNKEKQEEVQAGRGERRAPTVTAHKPHGQK